MVNNVGRDFKLETTNRFYRIVDESHTALTKQVMDQTLNGKTENHLDTEQTLARKISRESKSGNDKTELKSSVTPPHKNTYDSFQNWAVLDLNQ